MKAQQQDTSICETCINAPECTHYQNSRMTSTPIWFCEDFNDRASLHVAENEKICLEESSSHAFNPGIEIIPGRMKGLCINCDNRATCIFPVKDGGVWHCEEYC